MLWFRRQLASPGLMSPLPGDTDGHCPGEPPTGIRPTPTPAPGGRLNLLLSTAPWKADAWTHNLPRLLEPMGVTAHQAATARDAERVIRSTPIHIAVIDLTIPLDQPRAGAPIESGGQRVLDLLARLDAPPPTVVVKGHCSHRDETRQLQAALRCGVFAVVDRAAADLEHMLRIMQRCLSRHYADRWPEPPSPSKPGGIWV